MLFKKVGKDNVEDVIAQLVIVNNTRHYNIKYGDLSNGWLISIGVSDDIFINELYDKEPTVTLDKSNYILIPIKRNGNSIYDKKGNALYFVGESEMDSSGAYVVFDIPFNDINTLSYEASNNVDILSKACKELDGVVVELPLVYMKQNSTITFIADTKQGIRKKEVTFTEDKTFRISIT